MRILYLTADPGVPPLGGKGSSVHVRELVGAFTTSGASVVVASPRTDACEERLSGATLVGISQVAPQLQPTLVALRAAVERQSTEIERVARQCDVEGIYERFSLFSEGGVVAARRLGIPHVLEINAPLRWEARAFRSLAYVEEAAAIEQRVLGATDRIFAVSDELATLLTSDGVDGTKIDVVPNGVDPTKVPPRLRRRAQAPFVVGFAGSLKPWHGVEVLADACRRALMLAPDLRVEIVGDGPARSRIARLAEQPGVTAHGQRSYADTLALMSGWDVGLAPYLPLENFYFSPLKVLEYMAAGLCPIASDLGQIRRLLGAGKRGVLVEPANPHALAEAILGLVSDRGRAAALGARAARYVRTSHTWSHNARRAIAALRNCRVNAAA
jgi:glycosyltransferase involved in cell wall biosynthesis